MNRELTENDIKYPVLSMLFDGPSELAARAEALRDSIIHDLDDGSHPRFRQLEIISELLRPSHIDSGRLYQHALQQVALGDLRELIKSSEDIDSRTRLITTIEQVQKLANQLSFTINLSLEHTDGKLFWTETASINSTITLDTPSQQLEEPEPGLSEHDMITHLSARGYKITETTINDIEFSGGTLSINNSLVLEIKSTGIDSRFLRLFFRGSKKLVKKQYQLGDIVESLKDKEDNPSFSNRQLSKRYSGARARINRKVKAETGIDELICYKDKTYFVNRDLL